MTGGNDASTEASNDAFQDDAGVSGRGDAWSLLYAGAPLKPTSCPDCGNVFATDSTSCPWCGRIVASSEPAESTAAAAVSDPADEPATTPAPRSAAATQDRADASLRASAEATAAYTARQARTAENTAGLRRWASLLLAAAVLLVIATGLTIRARNNKLATVPTLTTVARPGTSATPGTTVADGSSTSAVVTTVATEQTVATTADTGTSTATTPTTVEPTTTATVTPTTTTPTTGGSAFTAEQQQAFDLAQSLSTAFTTKNWSRVRELSANPAPTDAQLEAFYGALTKVELVPAKVDKVTESTYTVFAGVVQVKSANGTVSSEIYCNRYSIDLLAKTVTNIKSQKLRDQAGAVEASSVAKELATTCLTPTFG